MTEDEKKKNELLYDLDKILQRYKEKENNEISIGKILSDIDRKLDVNKLDTDKNMDKLKVAIIGDEFHKGIKDVVVENTDRIEKLEKNKRPPINKKVNDTKKSSPVKMVTIISGSLVAIIETIRQIFT